MIETVLELNRQNLTTKSFVSRKGRVQQSKAWVAKELHRVISNPVYRGLIRHKGKEYPGEHEFIISAELWDAVQTKLRQHQPDYRKFSGHRNETAIAKSRLIHPLKGFLFGLDGQALTPTYTNKSEKALDGTKSRKRYRYYVSQQAIRQGYDSSPLKTLNATLLEEAVRRMLCDALPGLTDLAVSADLTAEEVRHRLSMQARHLAGLSTPSEYARWLEALAPKIIVGPESLTIHITTDHLSKLAAVPPVNVAELNTLPAPISTKVTQEGNKMILTASVSFKPQRGKCEIIDGETGKAITARKIAPNPALIQTIAQAEFWRTELIKHPDKSLLDITEGHGIKPAYVRRLLNAAYLAPAIKRAIFQGTQPAQLQVQDLLMPRSLDWKQQLSDLGFENKEPA